MKKLVQTIDLVFFQDDANGEYGVTHKSTHRDDDGFNAFWDGQGLFHDVFEHAHEHERYFRGECAMNIGGEMAAMGKLWYYYETLGLNSRMPSLHMSPGTNMRRNTEDLVEETISESIMRYGSTLESGVPRQRPTDNDELEYQIGEYVKNVRKCQPKPKDQWDKDGYEHEAAVMFKKSVTRRKIADLHRWGYRAAEKLVPNNNQNHTTLYEFLTFWKGFCASHPAEELASQYRGIQFRIYREGEFIYWKAEFVPMMVSSYDEQPKRIVVKSWEL